MFFTYTDESDLKKINSLLKKGLKMAINPMSPVQGIQVIGWDCRLEVHSKGEEFTIGFTRKMQDEQGPLTYVQRLKTEKNDFGFLAFGFLYAFSEGTSELKKWCKKMGVDIHPQILYESAKYIERGLALAIKHKEDVWSNFALKLSEQENGIKIIGFNTAQIVTADEILPLIYYEIMELIRLDKKIEKCSCGHWYVRQPHQRSVHCTRCIIPLSRRKTSDLSEKELKERRLINKNRIKKWRETQRIKEKQDKRAIARAEKDRRWEGIK